MESKENNKENNNQNTNQKNNTNQKTNDTYDTSSTIVDHSGKHNQDQACIVYKFQSRPPYEGFVLILVIIVIAILLIWWLSSKLKASEQ